MNEEIERLKAELTQGELELEQQILLLQKREEIDIAIDQLEYTSTLPPKEMKAFLKELKNKRQQIDTQLDAIDEQVEDKLSSLRTALTEKVLNQHPERKESYLSLTAQIESLKRKKLIFQEIAFQLAHLQSILSRSLEARQKIRRLGILSYIFGENPTMIISSHLKSAESQTKILLELIQTKQIQDEELIRFLSHLQDESGKQWGFKHIDTIISQADKKLSLFLETYEDKVLKVMRQLQEKEDERKKSLFA